MNSAFAMQERAEGLGGMLLQDYSNVRAVTTALAGPLSQEDACVQSMPDASPAKWHLAHTTWFFETFVLEKYEPCFSPFDAAFRVLFNSYYNGVGEQYPRPRRGMLTRPSLARVLDYRAQVDDRMRALLANRGDERELNDLVVLGLNHEQQHQELLLTDVKHLFSLNPMHPAYNEGGNQAGRNQAGRDAARPHAGPLEWIAFEDGVAEIGHAGSGFAFDNEMPRHPVLLRPFQIASRLVTNAEYLRFIEEGGYEQPSVWLSEGWNWIRDNGLSRPLYWFREEAEWREFTLAGARAIEPGLPVVHVSYFEADAYARWARARLPTEEEWEHAAGSCTVQGNFLGSGLLHPAPSSAAGLQQMFGDAWEWTRSSYSPYPGFVQPEGAIGEYNGKFMVNQYVLRGGSCATPADHVRASYRNFFPTPARWQFSGIRLARDC